MVDEDMIVRSPDLALPRPSDRFVRAPDVLVMTCGGALSIRVVSYGEFVIAKHVETVRAILYITLVPSTMPELASKLNLSEHLVGVILVSLFAKRVLISVNATEPRKEIPSIPFRRICLGISGAIHVLGTIQLVATLRTSVNVELEVIATSNARRFIDPNVLEYLGARVWSDSHAMRDGIRVPHIWLGEQSDLLLIAPASANTLQRLASGACSDLLSLVAATTSAPIVIAPSMHPAMWNYKPVARNVSVLREAGMFLLEPSIGYSVSQQCMEPGACAVSAANITDILPWLGRNIVRTRT